LPGLIVSDPSGGPVLFLETIFHEAAHNYLFMGELIEPLVYQSHTQLYWSPFRNDPRPLTGIFYAYHAIVFICSYYKDLINSGLIKLSEIDASYREMSAKLLWSERTLDSQCEYLTPTGLSIFNMVKTAAKYGTF
jgi:HEXXH motif-containing protein